MGWINIGFHYILWCLFNWSLHFRRDILFCRCRFSDLCISSYSIFWSTLSSCWMGLSKAVVNFRPYFHNLGKFKLYLFIPINAKELFNLQHAMAQNIIERIFGILKQWFHILITLLEIDMSLQVKAPATLTTIHNFIWEHDPLDFDDEDTSDPNSSTCVGYKS